MTQIIPAIIPESFEQLREQVGLVKGLVKRVQVDVIDGNASNRQLSFCPMELPHR